MADKTIGTLPAVGALYDDMLIPVEHQGEARSMTGEQLKSYVQSIVRICMENAGPASDEAAGGASGQ